MKKQLLKLWKAYNDKVGSSTCIRLFDDFSGIITVDHIDKSDYNDENRLIEFEDEKDLIDKLKKAIK